LVKALLAAAGMWTVRWCAKNWELFLLRILPLAGVVSAGVDVANHQAVVLNALVLTLCAAFFVTLRQLPAAHQEAKSSLETVGRGMSTGAIFFAGSSADSTLCDGTQKTSDSTLRER
jgi:hypothetical protein